MKLKILGCLYLLISSLSQVYAAENYHFHSENKAAANLLGSMVKNVSAGYCQITIINNSNDNVVVSGTFDDGEQLIPFVIYRYSVPHYISLYYYGYCHAYMTLAIVSSRGYYVFNGQVAANSSLLIDQTFTGDMTASISSK